MKVATISSVESEGTLSLTNKVATDCWSALLIENISHVIMMKLLGKHVKDWDILIIHQIMIKAKTLQSKL